MMLELYIATFCISALNGVAYAWNKKVFFGVWIFAVTWTLFRTSMGVSYDFNSIGISNWHYFGLMIVFLLGMYSGESMYKIVFGDKQ